MKFITFILIGLLFCGHSILAQDSTNHQVFYDADFDWTIQLPSSFELLNNQDWDNMQDNGEKALEETVGEDLVNHATTIFVFSAGYLNFLEANYQPFDPVVDGDYDEVRRDVNELLFVAMQSQMPNIALDSASTEVIIDDLIFVRFDIIVPLNENMTMQTSVYSRLFDKKEFTVNMMYIDAAKGKEMETALLNSTFGNKEEEK